MLEHAKWKYLHPAKLALNADTDELLFIKHGTTLDQVADYCINGQNSVWLYKGIWIEPVDSNTGVIAKDVPHDDRKFSNYWHTQNGDGRGIGVKWLLYPQKNLQYQWHLHKTFGPHMMTDDIGFGHYFAMNTSWSYTRDEFTGDKNSLAEVPEIKANIQKWIGK
jgi:hypothetical protein